MRRTNVRAIVCGIVAVATVACESADRRSFNERIDQREVAMAKQVELYEAFEAELVAELRDEYGATTEDGCPDLQPLPGVGSMTPIDALDEYQDRINAEAQARLETFLENLPAERCICLQGTLPGVRQAIEEFDLDRFRRARDTIAEMSDEALTQRVALRGLPDADAFPADVVEKRIQAWKARRHEDWVGDRDAWGDVEPYGWNDYRWRVLASPMNVVLATEGSLLTGLRRGFADHGCTRF